MVIFPVVIIVDHRVSHRYSLLSFSCMRLVSSPVVTGGQVREGRERERRVGEGGGGKVLSLTSFDALSM